MLDQLSILTLVTRRLDAAGIPYMVIQDLLKRRTGTERVRMISDMFDCGRALIVSNIRVASPNITERELRVKVFERLYRGDLEPDYYDAVVRRLREDDGKLT